MDRVAERVDARPPQEICPIAQRVTHAPAEQIAPAGQALPQAPQCEGSTEGSVHAPPHISRGAAQGSSQKPPDARAAGAHARSQRPQCAGLLRRSTQPAPQRTVPSSQSVETSAGVNGTSCAATTSGDTGRSGRGGDPIDAERGHVEGQRRGVSSAITATSTRRGLRPRRHRRGTPAVAHPASVARSSGRTRPRARDGVFMPREGYTPARRCGEAQSPSRRVACDAARVTG